MTSASARPEAAGKFAAGQMDIAEMTDLESKCCPGCGLVPPLHGQHDELPDGSPRHGVCCNGTIPAAYTGARRLLAKRAGAALMDLIKKDIKPRDISRRARPSRTPSRSTWASAAPRTPSFIWTAIAHEAGIELPAPLFDEISRRTPYITKPARPAPHDGPQRGRRHPGRHARALKKGLIHLDALTITGTVGDRIKNAEVLNRTVIHSVDDPYRKEGGIAILKGNLAPDYAVVIKASAVA